MAKPTVSAIRPERGHTGGETLVEIVGTNFRLPDAPPVTGLTDQAGLPASVRVLFGDEEATVMVPESTRLYVLTPKHAAGSAVVTVMNLDSTPAELTSATGPFVLSNGQTLIFEIGGEEQIITFSTSQFVSIGAATAAEVAAAINSGGIGVRAVVASGKVTVYTDAVGASVSFQVTGGTANGALGFSTILVTGSADRYPIPGESVEVSGAYEFVRPDLGVDSHLTRAVRALIQELKLQILENVHVQTHTDYDAETGDALNISYLANLPALVLVMTGLPENREGAHGREEFEITEDLWVEKDPPTIVDAEFLIVGVSNNAMELLNLLQAVKRFFKKNPSILANRYSDDADDGTIEYTIEFAQGSKMTLSVEGDNSNLASFTGEIVIRGIRLEDMPGITEATVPDRLTVGYGHEGTREFIEVAETITINAQKKV